MTGSSFFSRASWVRLRPNWSSTSEPRWAGSLWPLPSRSRPAGSLPPGRTLVARQQLDDLLAHPGQVGAELHEHLGGDALALTDEAEEDVLGADVVVAELQRLAQRQLEHLLGAGRERDVARRRRAALADDLLDLAAHGLEGDAERLERLGGDAFALVDQAEQDVLGADVVVVEEARFLLGQHDDSAGPVGEAFEQGNRLSGSGETYAESIGGLWKTRPAVSLSASSSSAETASDGGSPDDRAPIHVPVSRLRTP